MAISTATLAALGRGFHGRVILPADEDYEESRQIWHAGTNRRPAIIVRPNGTSGVRRAILMAREYDLPIAVRSGGHSMAGHGSCEGGMLIDLSAMNRIDLDTATRVARIEPGLTWGAVGRQLQARDLALTSGDTATVGVGGLVLAGGIGWMARKYGLTIDHLRSVELVTAQGEIVTANAEEHADLFWGLRGGGGNFGVATSFELAVDPVRLILGGAVFYEARQAEEILAAYVAYAANAPDELTTMAVLMLAPPAPFIPQEKQGTPIVAIGMCCVGDLADGEKLVAPLRRLAEPIADIVGPMPYPALFALTAEAEHRGLQHDVRSCFLKKLGAGALHALVGRAEATMSPGTLVEIRVLGGAVGRVAPEATAFAHRDKQFMVMVENSGADPDGNAARRARTAECWQALQPYAAGAYTGFMADEGSVRIKDAFPPATYARLAALKAHFDPDNVFRLNQNIEPQAVMSTAAMQTIS